MKKYIVALLMSGALVACGQGSAEVPADAENPLLSEEVSAMTLGKIHSSLSAPDNWRRCIRGWGGWGGGQPFTDGEPVYCTRWAEALAGATADEGINVEAAAWKAPSVWEKVDKGVQIWAEKQFRESLYD